MNTKEILLDWFSVKENRNKLPNIIMTQSSLDLLSKVGVVYVFGKEMIIMINEMSFNVLLVR